LKYENATAATATVQVHNKNATNTFNAGRLLNETKVGHGVDGAGFGNGLAHAGDNNFNATKLLNETKVGHGVDGAGFGNGLAHSNSTNATVVPTFNATNQWNNKQMGHGVDGAGFGNGLHKTVANVSSSVQARTVDEWHDAQKARLEAAAEAAWVKKETENAEVKARYEAFKADIAKNMTLENPWKNGVMSSGTDLPADGTENIPMSERKALPYPEAPTGIKYVNTTAVVSVPTATNTTTVAASNATATAQTSSSATSVETISKTLEGLFNLDPVPAVEAAKLISGAMKVSEE